MIMTHGWPSTVAEFLDVIGPLTDPNLKPGQSRRLGPEEIQTLLRAAR